MNDSDAEVRLVVRREGRKLHLECGHVIDVTPGEPPARDLKRAEYRVCVKCDRGAPTGLGG